MPPPKKKKTIGQALAEALTPKPVKPARKRKQLPGKSGRETDDRP